MKNQNVIIIICLFFSVIGYSQFDFKQFVPQNPNVSALFKSTITPVNEYSGTANINIPIYTLQEGGLSIPISIGYATGGIQVSEESSVVGLGWSLNAGGAITRNVNGIDDFHITKGFLANPKNHPDLPPNWNPETQPFAFPKNAVGSYDQFDCEFDSDNGIQTFYDLPPKTLTLDNDYLRDVFMFNFNGYGGSFVLSKNSPNAFLTSKTPIKIEYEGSGTGIYSNVKITALTEDGALYEFAQMGMTLMPNINPNIDYVSSWYLSKITDILGNEAIFNYDSSNTITPFKSFNQVFSATTGPSFQPRSEYKDFAGPLTHVDDILLTSIEIKKNGQKVQEAIFEYSVLNVNTRERLDVDSRFLKSVKIYNSSQIDPIEEFDLYQSYFGNQVTGDYYNYSLTNGDFAQSISALGSEFPNLNLRLKLDSVARNVKERHVFKYHENFAVPNKTSMSQDYWGFYNGVINPEVFIPEITSANVNQSQINQEKKANRRPEKSYAKMFSLKSVIYPTRGSTDYEYELNTFDQSFINNLDPIQVPTVLATSSASAMPGKAFDTVHIKPNPNKDLKVSFNVTLRGWNSTMHTGSTAPIPNFTTDFYVRLKSLSGQVIWSKVIESGVNNDWNNFTSELNGSMQAIVTVQDVVTFSHDNNGPANLLLTEGEYILEAFFDDHDGLYYGLSYIKAEWEESEVSETEQYSIGGGLRISKVIEKDYSGMVIGEKAFNYHYQTMDNGVEVTKTYGKIKTIPNFAINRGTVYHMSNWLSDGDIYGAIPTVIGSAGSQTPWSQDMGGYIGYDQVETYQLGANVQNGKVVKKYINIPDLFRTQYGGLENEDDYHKFPLIRVPHNGLPIQEEIYNSEGDTLRLTKNFYEVNNVDAENFGLDDLLQNTDFVISASKEMDISDIYSGGNSYYFCDALKFQLYPHYSNEVRQVGSIEKVYDQNGEYPITISKDIFYENDEHRQVTKTTETSGDGIVMETKIIYPDDINETNFSPIGGAFKSEGLINQLNSQGFHRINIPVQKETRRDGKLLAVERTEFGLFDNVILPDTIYAAKSLGILEPRLIYEDYSFGNPVQMKKYNGVSSSIIWGYDNTLPIAKIDNATYGEIASALGITENILKNFDESNIAQLDALRSSHPEFMVTTFQYVPLKGVTKITDTRGESLTYTYDNLNRLKEVWQEWGNINYLTSDYIYHYKGTSEN